MLSACDVANQVAYFLAMASESSGSHVFLEVQGHRIGTCHPIRVPTRVGFTMKPE